MNREIDSREALEQAADIMAPVLGRLTVDEAKLLKSRIALGIKKESRRSFDRGLDTLTLGGASTHVRTKAR